MGALILCSCFLVPMMFNIVLIIADLIFEFSGSECVNTMLEGQYMALSTWLGYDIIRRIVSFAIFTQAKN